eukprot:6239685-Alexandrium_andersonii.AAC.1
MNSVRHALNKHALRRSLAGGGGKRMPDATLSRCTAATALLFTECTREEARLELQGYSLHAPPHGSAARSLLAGWTPSNHWRLRK